MRPALLDPLFSPLNTLPGIGPKIGELYARLLGRESIEDCRVVDLVFHAPHSLIDRRQQPGTTPVNWRSPFSASKATGWKNRCRSTKP